MAARPGATSASQHASATVSTTLTTAAPEQPVHDQETMCRYPSKKCWNLRALKRNGEHHNLCDFHRQKANKNQRRLELKRKAARRHRPTRSPSEAPACAQEAAPAYAPRPSQRALAMKEEARAKQQAEEISRANTAAAAATPPGLTSWFLQDLVLLDGVYDRAGFQVKEEQSVAPVAHPLSTAASPRRGVRGGAGPHFTGRTGRRRCALQELGHDFRTGCLGVAAEGKTSPVDVGESWDSLDFGDYWLTPMPADQPIMSSDASVFGVDEDVFVADPALVPLNQHHANIRGAAGSTINLPGLIIGCVLVAFLVLGFLQQHMHKRKRRTRYHAPLQLQQSSTGVLEQLGKRKEDLQRYIDKLKEQLAAREDQLRYHDELEEIVTSRVETSRRDEEEWTRLMKAGKKVHGDNWNAANGEETSLRELMEFHKEELLEYKRSLQNQPESSRRPSTSRERQPAQRSSKFNLPLLKLQPVAPLPGATLKPNEPKFVPPQWQSTRAKAGRNCQQQFLPNESDASPPQKTVVPPLNFSRFTGQPTIGVSPVDEPAQKHKRKSFEATFQRQTRLAAMLRKKK
ncbi:hypothetical protein GQ600_1387 [Phytophthora cactorum]|nr:hypothetical protein GQ600_1387 [Phytophthora cactorum]